MPRNVLIALVLALLAAAPLAGCSAVGGAVGGVVGLGTSAAVGVVETGGEVVGGAADLVVGGEDED